MSSVFGGAELLVAGEDDILGDLVATFQSWSGRGDDEDRLRTCSMTGAVRPVSERDGNIMVNHVNIVDTSGDLLIDKPYAGALSCSSSSCSFLKCSFPCCSNSSITFSRASAS